MLARVLRSISLPQFFNVRIRLDPLLGVPTATAQVSRNCHRGENCSAYRNDVAASVCADLPRNPNDVRGRALRAFPTLPHLITPSAAIENSILATRSNILTCISSHVESRYCVASVPNAFFAIFVDFATAAWARPPAPQDLAERCGFANCRKRLCASGTNRAKQSDTSPLRVPPHPIHST